MPNMLSTGGELSASLGTRAPDTAARATRAAALAALVGLIVLCLAWELWLAPTGQRTLAIKVLPLLPALPGLWRMRLYTYRWVSLIVWLYAAEGLVRAGGEAGLGRTLAGAEVLLAVALFVACGLHVRWRLKRGQALAAGS